MRLQSGSALLFRLYLIETFLAFASQFFKVNVDSLLPARQEPVVGLASWAARSTLLMLLLRLLSAVFRCHRLYLVADGAARAREDCELLPFLTIRFMIYGFACLVRVG